MLLTKSCYFKNNVTRPRPRGIDFILWPLGYQLLG